MPQGSRERCKWLFARAPGPWAGQNPESRLTKMPVGRDRVGQAGLPHHHEARAIRKQEVFVTVLKG
jgi:hypothetical protein